jgi:hypothetical protein
MRKRKQMILALTGIFVAGILLGWPALVSGLPWWTHDASAHAPWSYQFSSQFWAGEWYPRWLSEANGGLGSPAFFYYHPLPHLITAGVQGIAASHAAPLRALGSSAVVGLILSGLFAFWWLRHLAPLWAATGAALCYLVMPYHLLLNLYTRGAFAEFWALTWLPLVLGFTHRAALGGRYSVVGLALAYAFLITSHLPTTLVFSLIPPVYAILVANGSQSWGAGIRTAAGMFLGIGVAAVYLVPAMMLQYAVTIEELTRLHPYERAFFLKEFTIPKFNGTGAAPRVFWSVLSMLCAGGCALVLCLKQFSGPEKRQAIFWSGIASLSVLMMLPLSKPVWELIQVLQIIQFPWRFGTVTSVATAALLALGIAAMKGAFSWRKVFVGQIVWVIIVGWVYATVMVAWPALGPQVSTGIDSLLRDVPEYRPRWVQADLQSTLAKFKGEGDSIDKVAFATGGGSVLIEQWKPRNNVLMITMPAASTVLVRQYYYPGWTTRVNGERRVVQISEPDGLVQLSLSAGVHRVELRLERTKQELWGWIITWTSLLIAAGVLISQWFLKMPGSGVASALATGNANLAADRKRAE